jgi:very-short-patch-repair endonuclease
MHTLRTTLAHAFAQQGLITPERFEADGRSARAFQRAVHRGELVELQRNIALPKAISPTPDQRIVAAVAAAGPTALASHLSAAYLWGFDTRVTQVDVIVPERSRSVELRGARLHRPRDLDDLAPVQRHGVPCTHPLRTVLDAGAVASYHRVRELLEFLLSARLLTLTAVFRIIEQHSRPGRHGIRALRAAADEIARLGRPADSELEHRMARLLADAVLPRASFQHRVGRYVLDFAFVEEMIDIECDGWGKYHDKKQFEHERVRDAWLQARGWLVIRFTWSMIVNRPTMVAARLAELLSVRGDLMRAQTTYRSGLGAAGVTK